MGIFRLNDYRSTAIDFEDGLSLKDGGYLRAYSGVAARNSVAKDGIVVSIAGRIFSAETAVEINGDNAKFRLWETGSISSYQYDPETSGSAVIINGANADVGNAGVITAVDGDGIELNGYTDVVSNYGVIEAAGAGIDAGYGLNILRNAGTIQGGSFAVFVADLTSTFRLNQSETGLIDGDVYLENSYFASRLGHEILGGTFTEGSEIHFSSYASGNDVFVITDLWINADINDPGRGISVFGYDGNDEIRGANFAYGGAGNDTLSFLDNAGSFPSSVAYGGEGRDTITGFYQAFGGAGGDTFDNSYIAYGGDGWDTFLGGREAYGERGADTFTGVFSGAVRGGAGNDHFVDLIAQGIIGNSGNDTFENVRATLSQIGVRGGPGDDIFINWTGEAEGNEGSDRFTLDEALNNVIALGGDGDDIFNLPEIDFSGVVIHGGEGDDVIRFLGGQMSGSTVYGDAGNDTFYGRTGTQDTVSFETSSSNFDVTENPNGSYSVLDLTSGDTDTLWEIDFLHFSDGTFAVDGLV